MAVRPVYEKARAFSKASHNPDDNRSDRSSSPLERQTFLIKHAKPPLSVGRSLWLDHLFNKARVNWRERGSSWQHQTGPAEAIDYTADGHLLSKRSRHTLYTAAWTEERREQKRKYLGQRISRRAAVHSHHRKVLRSCNARSIKSQRRRKKPYKYLQYLPTTSS